MVPCASGTSLQLRLFLSFPGSATSARYFPWRAREASTSQKNGSPPPPPVCRGHPGTDPKQTARVSVSVTFTSASASPPAPWSTPPSAAAAAALRGGARRRTTNVHQPHVVRQIIRRPVVVVLLLLGDPVEDDPPPAIDRARRRARPSRAAHPRPSKFRCPRLRLRRGRPASASALRRARCRGLARRRIKRIGRDDLTARLLIEDDPQSSSSTGYGQSTSSLTSPTRSRGATR